MDLAHTIQFLAHTAYWLYVVSWTTASTTFSVLFPFPARPVDIPSRPISRNTSCFLAQPTLLLNLSCPFAKAALLHHQTSFAHAIHLRHQIALTTSFYFIADAVLTKLCCHTNR